MRSWSGLFREPMEQERCGACDNCRRGLSQLAERPVANLEVGQHDQPEAPDSEPELGVGDRVKLPKYGAGQVEAIDNGALVVRFADGRQRKFKREFARRTSRSRQKM